jgi:uncharacterized protein YutE (UPF0331/DUF86 family)
MADDVVLNKAATLERCLARVVDEFGTAGPDLDVDQTRQDALVLNLMRACETAIDLAMHVVRLERLGVPQTSREAFDLLATSGVIDPELGKRLKSMVGFRNIAVHQYQQLDMAVVRAIVEHRLDDFREFVRILLQRS